jgi:hypothetical protein
MSQYIHYTFANNSSGITNYGTGGAAYNGHARRNQYRVNAKGHPIWGPMTDNADVISVPGGISNPYHHTWQIGLNIARFWPVAGVVSDTLCGNDGKLFSYANDQYYGYIHQEGTYPPLRETNVHNFFVEIAGAGGGNVEFWLGVGANRPVKVGIEDEGNEGGRHWWGFNWGLQLNVNYYFQIKIDLSGGVTGSDYYINNCAPGCADYMVTGFPAGCYYYCWREDNTALNLANGGNWAQDVGLWTGAAVPAQPGVTPPVPAVRPHIWNGIYGEASKSLYTTSAPTNGSVVLAGLQGAINPKGNWIAGKYSAALVEIVSRNPAGTVTDMFKVQPDKNGNFRAAIKGPSAVGLWHYNARGATGEWGNDCTVQWHAPSSVTPVSPTTPAKPDVVVPPATTPPSPQDVTLDPVSPIPQAMAAGLTIVLRDHKKKA